MPNVLFNGSSFMEMPELLGMFVKSEELGITVQAIKVLIASDPPSTDAPTDIVVFAIQGIGRNEGGELKSYRARDFKFFLPPTPSHSEPVDGDVSQVPNGEQ